eukprot:gene24980-30456_t
MTGERVTWGLKMTGEQVTGGRKMTGEQELGAQQVAEWDGNHVKRLEDAKAARIPPEQRVAKPTLGQRVQMNLAWCVQICPLFEEEGAASPSDGRRGSPRRLDPSSTIVERSRAMFALKSHLAQSNGSQVAVNGMPEQETPRGVLPAPGQEKRLPAPEARKLEMLAQLACPGVAVYRVQKPSTAEAQSGTMDRALSMGRRVSHEIRSKWRPGAARTGEQLWEVARKAYVRVRREDRRTSQRLCRLCGLWLLCIRMAFPLRHMQRACARPPRPEAEGADEEGGAKEGAAQQEDLLPLERLLGTALALAAISAKRLLPPAELQRQLELASAQAWSCPPGRSFEYYLGVFKLMLSMHFGSGSWYRRAALWNLVLLQEVEGCFWVDGTGDVATALRAGEPEDDTALMLRFSDEVITASIPLELAEAFGVELHETKQVRSTECLQAWATILAVCRYRTLPFAWCLNPEAAPGERRSLEDAANDWLEGLAAEHPPFVERLEYFRVTGGLKMTGERVTGGLNVTGGRVTGGLNMTGEQVTGGLKMTGERVTGGLNMTGEQVTWGLNMTGERVTGGLKMTGEQVTGGLKMTGEQVTGGLKKTGGQVTGGLKMTGDRVTGGLNMTDEQVTGGLKMTGEQVTGGLNMTGEQ